MTHTITLLGFVLLLIVVALPLEITWVKWFLRNVVFVWANEVRKAWRE